MKRLLYNVKYYYNKGNKGLIGLIKFLKAVM